MVSHDRANRLRGRSKQSAGRQRLATHQCLGPVRPDLDLRASGLPDGLSIDSSSGLISGTIANTASLTTPYSVTVTATDGSHPASTAFRPLGINEPPSFSASPLDLAASTWITRETCFRARTRRSTKEDSMAKPETRIQELHLTLPPAPKPMAKYKTGLLVGNMLYVSGHGPAKLTDKTPVVGRVGADLTAEQGKEVRPCRRSERPQHRARDARLPRQGQRLVKTLGMVNCTADFKEQPQVINGFSELMAEVFGEDAGVGVARAVGMGSLPGNIPVEVECQFEVTP